MDLIAFVQANKDTLVLKPGGEYGGRGVVLGWEVNQVEWETKLAEACKGSYIVQERVSIGSESFPSIENGDLVFRDRFFDLDPYVWNGTRIEGCGVRLSSVSLLNVSAGGGSGTPLFLLK